MPDAHEHIHAPRPTGSAATPAHLSPSWAGSAASGLLVAIAYVLTGKLALLLAVPPGYASAIFPPAGLAIAAAYMWGPRLLPWVFVGSLLLNLWAGVGTAGDMSPTGAYAALVIALASTLQASLGAWALRRLIGHPSSFDRARDLLAFFLLTPFICLVSVTVSVGGLYLLGLTDGPNLAPTAVRWWLGDTLGVAVLFPILLIFFGEPRTLWRSRRWTVAVPMLGALALSIAVFVKVSQWEQEDELSVFRAASQQFAAQLQNGLHDHEVLVSALAGFMSHDHGRTITPAEFGHFARNSAIPFPVLQAMEWAPRVEGRRRRGFEQEHGLSRPGFAVRERDAEGRLVAAGDRPEYFPVTYVEPLEGNRAALGFDLASHPERRQAILRAMAEDVPVATPPIRLVQEQAQQAGALLMLRVSDGANAPGVVLTVIRMGDFVTRNLPDDKSLLDVRLVDAAAGKAVFGPDEARRTGYLFEKTLRFGTRDYRLQVSPTEAYLARHQSWQSLVFHAAGLFGTSLLGAILLLGTGYTVRVERLVEERTAALATESRKNQVFLRSTGDGLHILDASQHLVDASDSFFRLLGYRREELIGRPSSIWTIDPAAASPDPGGDYGWDESAGAFQMQYRRKDGSRVDVEVSTYALELDGQSLLSLSARDVSERRKAQEQIRQLAFFDTLTGLPNRRLLIDRLTRGLDQARRHGRKMAVMFLDLDKFKNINDTLGHDAGDELLKEVAARLTGCVRAVDTVARQGGDEFVVLLTEISHARDAERVAQKIIAALAEPVQLLGNPHRTSTSIGICVRDEGSDDDVQELMKKADIAMYEAKKAGRNGYRFSGASAAAD